MTPSAASSTGCAAPSSTTDPAAIDASCRWPVLTLFKGAAFWLVVSSVFGLIASLKFHKPDFMADSAMFSYGRAYAVWADALVYGFCVPSALAAGLWILARLGRVKLQLPVLATVGGKLWHLGMFFGLVGILRGNATGYDWFELPRYATIILLGSFLLVVVSAFVTHANRTARELQPAQWFTLASLFWLPWILSTACLLLQFFPVRGVAQAAIAWWYSGNMLLVWLTLAGLGMTFYLLPKLAQRPLSSSYNALFVFWTLIIFGTWTGIQSGVALPAWMPALSGGAAFMLLAPALAIAVCARQTGRGVKSPDGMGSCLCFTGFGVWSLVLGLVLLAVTGIPQVSGVTDFTWYGQGHTLLRLYGFFAMTAVAAAYHILPRVTNRELCLGGIKLHFWLAMPGALLMSLPLIVGGVLQGLNWLRPDVEFLKAAKPALMALRLASIGEVLFALGAVLFCLTVLRAVYQTCRATVTQACADEPAITGTEVRA
jgi:cytochrome c oxidase cbb3-type subunit 1